MDPLLTTFALVLVLAFFVTVIALVAIVFGRWKIAEQAVNTLGDTLKKSPGSNKCGQGLGLSPGGKAPGSQVTNCLIDSCSRRPPQRKNSQLPQALAQGGRLSVHFSSFL